MAKFKRGSLALARQVFNTPQLILAEDLQTIAQYLVNRANGDVVELDTPVVQKETRTQLSDQEEQDRKYRRLGITNDGRRGNLEVTGTLVAKHGEIDANCMELTSYEGLYNKFVQQVNEGIEELVLHVDSGGGSAFSCFEMAQEVKSLAVEKGIKIYAYVDGLSASAAYAWTSIADEIIARPDSEIGSVGVVVQLINNSKMLENIGITRKFITHGDQKIPFDAEGDFSPKFLETIQKKVDKTGLEFNTFIAKNRNMDVNDVIATQAEVFDSDEALNVGFIDKIMTRSEFFDNYLPKANSTNQNLLLQKEEGMSKQTEQNDNVTVAMLTEQLQTANDLNTKLQASVDANATLKADFDKLQASFDALVEEKAKAEKQAKTDNRKAQLAEVLGKDNEQLDSLVETFEALSDEQFTVVASSYGVTMSAKKEEMKELGDKGQESDQQLSISESLLKRAKAK